MKQGLIFGSGRIQLLAAPVGQLQGRLQQEQALFGRLRTNPGSFRTGRLRAVNLEGPAPHDPAVILPGIAGLAGKLEPTAALDAAVAMAVVAALPGEDSLQIQGEAGRAGPGRSADADGGLHRPAPEFGGQPSLAAGQCDDLTPAIHPGRPGIRQGEAALPGEVPLHAITVSTGEQELLGGALALQRDRPGPKAQREQPGGGCGSSAFVSLRGVDRFLFGMAGLCDRQHQPEPGQPEGSPSSGAVAIVAAGSIHRMLLTKGRPVLRMGGREAGGLRMRPAFRANWRPPVGDFPPGPSGAPSLPAEAAPSYPKRQDGPGCEGCGASGWPERRDRPRS